LASAAVFAAFVRPRAAEAFALRAVVVRAAAPRLAARVPAACLAAVERFVAFVLRVAAALTAAVWRVVWLGVFVSWSCRRSRPSLPPDED